MIEIIISALWFFLPAGIANMMPTLVKRIQIFNIPIDPGYKFYKKPLIGSHKTYRGLLAGIVGAILVIYMQRLFTVPGDYALIDYMSADIWKLGFLLGCGALMGDLLKSFVKRRFDIPLGAPWVPFDQLDWIFGALFAASFYILPPYPILITIIILFGLLHPLINLLGYYLRLKPNKF